MHRHNWVTWLWSITLLVHCSTTVHGYYNQNQRSLLEQFVEQKYESPSDEQSEVLQMSSNDEKQQQATESYSQVVPADEKTYEASSSDSYDSYSDSDDDGGGYGQSMKPLSKITQIPSGSMFPMSDGKQSSLEFESPYAKEPYSIVFRTQSMPVKIKQQHQAMPAPEVEFVRSQEDPHRIKHEVIRPVIQEIHEIIQPYRRVVQEVRPVIENVHTIVSKGEGRGGRGSGGGGGSSGGGMAGSYSENQARFVPMPNYRAATVPAPAPIPAQSHRRSTYQPQPSYHPHHRHHYSALARGRF